MLFWTPLCWLVWLPNALTPTKFWDGCQFAMTFTSGYISAPAGTLYFFPKASPMLGFSFNFSFDARERYSMLDGDGMLDGHETVEIACRELRYRACWTEMGRGRTRNRGNSLRRASLPCWTEMGRGRTRNRGNSLRKASLACGREQYS